MPQHRKNGWLVLQQCGSAVRPIREGGRKGGGRIGWGEGCSRHAQQVGPVMATTTGSYSLLGSLTWTSSILLPLKCRCRPRRPIAAAMAFIRAREETLLHLEENVVVALVASGCRGCHFGMAAPPGAANLRIRLTLTHILQVPHQGCSLLNLKTLPIPRV